MQDMFPIFFSKLGISFVLVQPASGRLHIVGLLVQLQCTLMKMTAILELWVHHWLALSFHLPSPPTTYIFPTFHVCTSGGKADHQAPFSNALKNLLHICSNHFWSFCVLHFFVLRSKKIMAEPNDMWCGYSSELPDGLKQSNPIHITEN